MEKDVLTKLKMNSREEAVKFLKSLITETPQPVLLRSWRAEMFLLVQCCACWMDGILEYKQREQVGMLTWGRWIIWGHSQHKI